MAEYNMTYEDLNDFLEECIRKSDNSEVLRGHRAEILAAITVKNEEDCAASVREELELWENQIGRPSELLLGTRYIRIKDSMITFIEAALTSGFADAVIANPENPMKGMSVGIVSGVVIALIEIFSSASRLEDYDFCVYMQAVTHFRTHREFTLEELTEWFPHGDKAVCNMHNSKWDCEFAGAGDICSIAAHGRIEEAVRSLCDKKILDKRRENRTDIYFFPV